MFLHPGGCALPCPRPGPLPHAPTHLHTKHQRGSAPREVRSGQGSTHRLQGPWAGLCCPLVVILRRLLLPQGETT